MMDPYAAEGSRRVVSVVVPVRNGGLGLGELISALEAQTLPREQFEIIIADDGSCDGATERVVTRDGRVRVDIGPPRNSYAARNRGARLATAPVLAFCDADCRPDPKWLEAGLEALKFAAVVGGRIRFHPVPRASLWALLDIEHNLDQEHLVRMGGVSTANVFLRRDIFDRLEGFDASLPSGGDINFGRRCRAAGCRILFDPSVVVSHPPRDTAAAYLKKEWRIHHSAGQRPAGSGTVRPSAEAARSPAPVVTTGRMRLKGWLTHVPILTPMRARAEAGLPVRLNRTRLADAGINPSLVRELAALAVQYCFIYYFQLLARRCGNTRRVRRGPADDPQCEMSGA
jgi:hypothetical protein